MRKSALLEICAESLDLAVAAECGNAHRIELCANLFSGGITPDAAIMRAARKAIHIPIHVLVRPRPGDFCFSASEFEIMKYEIQIAKDLGMDGIVVGLLDKSSRIDVARTSELVELARPLPVTFHRAFDQSGPWQESLEAVVRTGAQRILTSGCSGNAPDGLSTIKQLVSAAEERAIIMPGGGITASNVLHVLNTTSAQEVHTSLGASAHSNGQSHGMALHPKQYENKVREIVSVLGQIPAKQAQ